MPDPTDPRAVADDPSGIVQQMPEGGNGRPMMAEELLFENCTIDLSGADYLAAIRAAGGLYGVYDDGSRVLVDNGSFNAHDLMILSRAAYEKRIEEARRATEADLRAEVERLRATIREMIEAYEFCSADEYDRGWSVMSDAVHDARAALSQGQKEARMADQNNAPERIWLDECTFNGAVGFAHSKKHHPGTLTEYIRTDRAAPEGQVRVDARWLEVAEAFREWDACDDAHEYGRVIEKVRAAYRAALRPQSAAPEGQVRAQIANLSVWSGKAHPDQQLVDLSHVLAILDAALTPTPAAPTDNTALVEENARLHEAMLVFGAYLLEKGEAFRTGEGAELMDAYDAALASREAPPAVQEPKCTGVKDKDGNILFLGDRVRYRKEGCHTKKEYWNPEYEIIWKAPGFTLKHVGGGKDEGSYDFMLRCGGGNGVLELVKRGPHAAPPPACQQEAVTVAEAAAVLLKARDALEDKIEKQDGGTYWMTPEETNLRLLYPTALRALKGGDANG